MSSNRGGKRKKVREILNYYKFSSSNLEFIYLFIFGVIMSLQNRETNEKGESKLIKNTETITNQPSIRNQGEDQTAIPIKQLMPRNSVGGIKNSTQPHTKSIMNVSGTSGAVVNNTPESGLKRTPTVTFSEPKAGINLKLPTSPRVSISKTLPSSQQSITSPTSKNIFTTTSQPQKQRQRQNSTLSSIAPFQKEKFMSDSLLYNNDKQMAISHRNKDTIHNDTSFNSETSKVQSLNNKLSINKTLKETNNIKDSNKLDERVQNIVNDSSQTQVSLVSPRGSSSSSSSNSPRTSITNSTRVLNSVLEEKDSSLHNNNGKNDENNNKSLNKPLINVQDNRSLDVSNKNMVFGKDDPSARQISPSFIEPKQFIAPNIPKRDSGKNIDPRLPQDDGKLHVLFGATGSLSVFKIKPMIKKLEEIYGRDRISIQVVLTESASSFLTKRYLQKISSRNSQTSNISNNFTPKTPTVNDELSTPTSSFIQRISSDVTLISNLVSSAQQKISSTASTTTSLSRTGTNLTETVGTANTNTHTNNTSGDNSPVVAPQIQPQLNNISPRLELPPHIQVWRDQDEWDVWKQRTDPVLHIELRRWADILVVAPMTANTLSKIALGLCDNLLTSIIRAWNPMFPIFLAPSMVSSTFNSVMTKKQLNIIKDEMPWITVFKPSEKVMSINGDIGLGGMMDANEIVDKIVMKLGGYPKDEDEDDDEEEDDDDAEEDEDNNTDKKTAGDEEDEDDDDEDDDDDDEEEEEEEEEEEQEGQKITITTDNNDAMNVSIDSNSEKQISSII